MSYLKLAAQLKQAAETTTDNYQRLEGEALAKAAEALEKALGRYENKLQDFLGGLGPGIRELEEWLQSPQAKTHLKVPALQLISRELFGAPLEASKVAAAKKEFLQRVRRLRQGEEALAALKRFFLQAAQRPQPGKDEASLRQEFYRLGSLSDEELAFEFSDRLKSVSVLKALAKANAIPFSKEAKKDKLIEMITHYARRAYGNVSG